MNEYVTGAFFALECVALIYTIYILVKNHELKRDNRYLSRCLKDEQHRNHSRQVEKTMLKGQLEVKEQEIKHLKERLGRYESNT